MTAAHPLALAAFDVLRARSDRRRRRDRQAARLRDLREVHAQAMNFCLVHPDHRDAAISLELLADRIGRAERSLARIDAESATSPAA